MVSDEDRDYMWAEYAKDPRMKANIGIRRRLATLLENDRNQQELFTAMLLSACPVRRCCTTATRSAWATTSGSATGTASAPRCSGRRTATPGFSRCDPARLYLPAIMDPIYGFQTVNVEAQMNSHRLAAALDPPDDRDPQAARALSPSAQFTDLGGSNPTVLSYALHYRRRSDGITARRTRCCA